MIDSQLRQYRGGAGFFPVMRLSAPPTRTAAPEAIETDPTIALFPRN
jgi:hypothetical protein